MKRWGPAFGLLLLCALLVACGLVGSTGPLPVEPNEGAARSFYQTDADPGSLLVVGDWGSGTEDESLIASEMESYSSAHPVQAILTTGDNFYEDDPDEMMQPFHWARSAGIDFWLTWGNHDVESSDRVAAVNTAFGNPPSWATIEWGETEILILDSNDVDSAAQLSYLESEMERIEAPTIVVFHHPPFSCSDHGDNEAVQREWLPRFDDDVILVLNGHAHTYQRFEQNGVPYVVTGGGGRDLDELGDCPSGHVPRVVSEEAHNFLTMTQAEHVLSVSAVGEAGEAIDAVNIPLD